MKKIFLALALLFGVGKVQANTMEDVIQQNLGAIHNVSLAVATIQPGSTGTFVLTSSGTVGATLWYTGTSTEADVTINQTSIQFYAPYNVPDTSIFPVSNGVYDFSPSSATVGTFCQAVNASANYKCKLDGLRSDQPGSLLLDVTAKSGIRNLKNSGGFQVGIDTGGVTGTLTSGLLGPTTSFIIAVGMSPVQTQHRVVLRKCTANTADATGLGLRVYGVLREYEGLLNGPTAPPTTLSNGTLINGNTSINAWPGNLSDATPVDIITTTVNTDSSVDYTLAQGTGIGLEFAKGTHVVVQTGPYPQGSVGNGATNYLRCLWDEKP